MLRVGRVLLADARVQRIGVPNGMLGGNPRVVRTTTPEDFDVVLAHDLGSALTSQALERNVPVVIAENLLTPDARISDGANLEGFARCLSYVALDAADAESASVGWTVPGKKLSRGPSLVFPAPIGKLYVVDDRAVAVAPHDGDLAAVIASATGRNGDVTYSLVDDRQFLEAIILASAAISTATDGPRPAEQMGESLIREGQRAGLVIASKVA